MAGSGDQQAFVVELFGHGEGIPVGILEREVGCFPAEITHWRVKKHKPFPFDPSVVRGGGPDVDASKGPPGITKGSLYNAFGSKKELFTRALLKYDRDNRQKAMEHLEALDDPVKAITAMFDGLIAESAADTEQKGCLLVNTALELPHHTEDVREMVNSALGDLEGFFKRLIIAGQGRGSIPKSINAKETAKSLLSLVVAIRVLARGVYDADGLKAIKKDALRLISA